jgi:hypothetical protein
MAGAEEVRVRVREEGMKDPRDIRWNEIMDHSFIHDSI